MPIASTTALLIILVAAVCDLRTRRIPNWLTIPALVAAFAWQPTLNTLYGFLLAVAIYLPLWLLGGRGAGDLKLMAAIGAWLGAPAFIQLLVLTALVGGVWAIILIVVKRRTVTTVKNIFEILRSLVTGRKPQHQLTTSEAIALPHAAIVALAMLLLVTLVKPQK